MRACHMAVSRGRQVKPGNISCVADGLIVKFGARIVACNTGCYFCSLKRLTVELHPLAQGSYRSE